MRWIKWTLIKIALIHIIYFSVSVSLYNELIKKIHSMIHCLSPWQFALQWDAKLGMNTILCWVFFSVHYKTNCFIHNMFISAQCRRTDYGGGQGVHKSCCFALILQQLLILLTMVCCWTGSAGQELKEWWNRWFCCHLQFHEVALINNTWPHDSCTAECCKVNISAFLGGVIRSFGTRYHQYSEDIWPLFSLSLESDGVVQVLNQCLDTVVGWLS